MKSMNEAKAQDFSKTNQANIVYCPGTYPEKKADRQIQAAE